MDKKVMICNSCARREGSPECSTCTPDKYEELDAKVRRGDRLTPAEATLLMDSWKGKGPVFNIEISPAKTEGDKLAPINSHAREASVLKIVPFRVHN